MSDEPAGLSNVHTLRTRAKRSAQKPQPPNDGNEQGKDAKLPEGCPVRPIGVNGEMCFYLDQLGQLREMKAKDHSRLNLVRLFGREVDYLWDTWPRMTQDKDTGEWRKTGWKPELCAEGLMRDCAKLGVWSVEEKVRGSGAWVGKEGELILHCGDELLVARPDAARGDRWSKRAPGLVDDMVYPTDAPGMKPHNAPQPAGPGGPAAQLLGLLETFSWRRDKVDAHLLLGWIGAAMLGGALDWRAVVWITGGKGTGKSMLQKWIKHIMGTHGLLQTPDATTASVRQVLKHSSRPVAIDEAEAEEDNRKMQGLIKLARDAASGSMSLRGGQDHTAVSFTVRSCFMFSSILIPPLLSQDRSRMAVLELDPLGDDAATVSEWTQRRLEEIGSKLLSRLVGQWSRFARTVELYRDAMAEAGHSARGQDVFGTLLACADCMLADEIPCEEMLVGWMNKLAADVMAETAGDITDENACLGHLLTSLAEDVRNRNRQTVGGWIAAALNKDLDDGAETRAEIAKKVLSDIGILVKWHGDEDVILIANNHQGLSKIFQNTQWASRPGAQGVWVQALRRLPHIPCNKSFWFGVTGKGTMLPAKLCLPGAERALDSAAPLFG